MDTWNYFSAYSEYGQLELFQCTLYMNTDTLNYFSAYNEHNEYRHLKLFQYTL